MQAKSRWVKSEPSLSHEGSIYDYNSVRYRIPLKPRVDAVIKSIDSQIDRLDLILKNLRSKDDEIFHEVMPLVKENKQYSAVFLSELTQVMKTGKIVYLCKIVLGNLKVSLKSVSGIEELVSILSPTIAVVKNIRSSLISHMPDSEDDEIGVISELLGGILIDAGQIGNCVINFQSANEQALNLVNEASLTAEQKTQQDFRNLLKLAPFSSVEDQI
jgi:hypothetical protein